MPHPSPTGLGKALAALAMAAGVIGMLFWWTAPAPLAQSLDREGFYQEKLSPALVAHTTANAAALQSLESSIHALFETYRNRVPAFTEDITGFRNKTKITWEAMKQTASDDKKKVERHVTGKFEMHVVSGSKLEKDLEKILHEFRRDVEANRNRMLVEIDAAVRAAPELAEGTFTVPQDFIKSIEERIRTRSVRTGQDAVVTSGMTLFVSLAAEEAVRRLVVQALARVGTSMAASMAGTAAASAGATAAGGAGGGATGSLGGPAGAIIGIAAGLAVGIVIDVVMTDRMEARLNDECTRFLTRTEKELTRQPGGLVSSLAESMKLADQVTAESIKTQLLALP